MAEEIKVTVTNETVEDSPPVATQESMERDDNGPPRGGMSEKKAKNAEGKNGGLVAALVAVQHVTPYVNQVVNMNVSTITARTGSQELQQKAEIVAGFASSGTSIAIGALVGGAPGAAVSAAMQAVSSAIAVVSAKNNIDLNKRIETEAINLRKSRTGQTVNRSRTGGIA